MQNDIEAILATLTPEEKQAVLTIMNEQASTGSSSSLAELYNEDYEEVPVDIDTFLESPLYLGNSTNNGTAIYPYWRNCYREIIEQDKIEICMGGSIGCGKTTAAIYLMAYFFYKLMCLRNPRQYFGLEGNGPISIAFLNNTIQLSKGVAYDKFMTTISTSPWFLDRGEIRGTVNLRYKPEKNIEFVLGSSSDQIIGRDIFCLTGDTLVETAEGSMYLRDLENKSVYVKTLDNDGNIITSEKPCRIVKTKLVAAVRMILLQDKSTLSCTYNHRFLMADMSYKEAKEITRGDRLYSPTSENGMLVVGTNMATYQKSIPVYDVLDVEPYHNFLVNTGKNLVVSHNCAIQDECNFSKNADIHLEKNKVLETYNACFGRIKNRFTINGRCQGRIFLVSSKKTEYDFLNQFVEKKMKSKVDAPNLYVADAKAFEVKPKGSYSGKMFRVAVGGANLPSKIPEDDETTEELIHQGYEVHEAPIELRGDFELDINRYIADHLGISVSEVIKFIPYIKLEKCYKDIQNPVSHEVVLANLSDKIPVETYFKPQIVPESIYRKPIFIHIDTSGGKTDNTGISAVACMGFVNRNRYSEESGKEETTKQMLYRHVFSLGLNAEKHTEISFQKLVDFLWYLKYKLGWNIKAVSTDGYMGQFLRQQIAAAGFQEVNYVSLDRTPEGYLALQSILAEERIALIKLNLLETELVRLERNNISGRIDHPIDGCFTGDTLIRTNVGYKRIDEIVADYCESLWYTTTTYNTSKHIFEEEIIRDAWCTKWVKVLTEVSLSDGTSFHCTPDHKVLIETGEYVAAKDLSYAMINELALCSVEENSPIYVKQINTYTLDEAVPVYDLEIEHNHNFALACGVIVHNSKDIADSLAGALYNATLHEKDLQLGNEELLDMIVDANPRSVPSGNYKQQESAAVSADEVQKILDQIKETQPKFSEANARKVAARQALINKMQEEDWENNYQDMNDGFLI